MSFADALQRHKDAFDKVSQLQPVVEQLADEIADSLTKGGKIIFMGNGGSAADSQHLAAEFVVRYKAERRPMAALALTVDTSILTAHSNDYDFSSVFTRQIEALCKPEDLVIGISTSGNSANIIDAFAAAKQIGATCWAWTGASGGKLNDLCDNIVKAPSSETARVQEAHIFIGHWLCEEIDRRATQGQL